MAALTIRKLPEETHRALKARAAANGHSAEAEVRAILEQALRPPEAMGLGTELAAIGRRFNITTEFDNLRDPSPAEPADFG